MATITQTAGIQLISLLLLYLELDTDGAVRAHIVAWLQKVPRLYRPSVVYEYHRFRLSDLDDTSVWEFTW
jgi:hypothetical protein